MVGVDRSKSARISAFDFGVCKKIPYFFISLKLLRWNEIRINGRLRNHRDARFLLRLHYNNDRLLCRTLTYDEERVLYGNRRGSHQYMNATGPAGHRPKANMPLKNSAPSIVSKGNNATLHTARVRVAKTQDFIHRTRQTSI